MTKPVLHRADLPPLLQRALDIAVDAKAVAPAVLQLTEVAGYTDYALIVSGRSDRHVGGVTEALMAGLKDMGTVPIGTDGLDEHLWDLLDYDDFLIHVFYHPVRKHYDLESMWRDAPRVELDLPAEVMDTAVFEGLAPPDNMPPFRGGSFGAFPGELEGDEDEALPGELPPDDAASDAADPDEEEYAYAGDDADLDDEDDEDGEDGEDGEYAEYADEPAVEAAPPVADVPPVAPRRK